MPAVVSEIQAPVVVTTHTPVGQVNPDSAGQLKHYEGHDLQINHFL